MAEWASQHLFLAIGLCIASVVAFFEIIIDRLVLGLLLKKSVRLRVGKRLLAAVSVVLVAITYFTAIAATAVVMKLAGRRLLSHTKKGNSPTYWVEREQSEPSLEKLRRQG